MAEMVMTSGKPFNQTIRVVGAKTVWPTLDLLEVRAQLRAGLDSDSRLIANLHVYMTWAFDGDDLVISWNMTGAQTNVVTHRDWNNQGNKGVFNLVVSDIGANDNKALVVGPRTVRKEMSTTTTAGYL